MIPENINHQFKYKWPKYSWIFFVQTAYYIWTALTLGLIILFLSDIIIPLVLTIFSYASVSDINIFNILQSSIWSGWVILAGLIWMYWRYRLHLAKVAPIHNGYTNFLVYSEMSVKKLLWRSLGIWQKHSDQRFLVRHLLPTLLKHKGAKLSLFRLGISVEEIRESLNQYDDGMDDIFDSALDLASADNSPITWAHLLDAVLTKAKVFMAILNDKKITLDEASAVVKWSQKDINHISPQVKHGLIHDLFTPRRNLNKNWTARPTPVLDRFSRNLTDLAKVGFLSSAKVRKSEVEESIRILSKSSENSLVLVGEAGVGKTSIVGDIALRMIRGDIPSLADYKLISLDIGAMLGSNMGFQKLFSKAVNEASYSGNTILFIGNLDQLGKARAKEGFDLSAILLGALQSNLQLIGTSDPLNYKKYIANNSNLVQLFSKVNIEELDFDKAVLVLEDWSRKIELQQRVLITLDAVKKAVELSQKYIHTGKIPDKALGILDEAAVWSSRHRLRKVTAKEVEIVMSTKTNVPIGEIDKDEKTKLTNLEDKIKTRLIGQTEAVTAVVSALKRARLGVSANTKRPIGTFMFLGPTGVGKTELAKTLAWSYFGDETKIIRLDMSEYQNKDSLQRLLGASASSGDVALAGGKFTEAVKQTPFSVILLDEIEKAHPEVLDIFLQVLDEGRLTDNLGNTVDFTHTIIIATSNAQARFVQEAVSSGMPYEDMQKQLADLLVQKSFRPEFINRFDGVIVFKPLTKLEIEQITKIKLDSLIKHLKTRQDVELVIENGVVEKLAEIGFDPAFGARPLGRVIRDKIETKVANELLKSDNKKITITLEDIE